MTTAPPANSTWTPGQNRCSGSNEEFRSSAYRSSFLLLFPVAFICNSVVLLVFYLRKSRRNSAFSVVMVNMALSDWGFSLTLPLRLIYYFSHAIWTFPDWLCRLCHYLFYLNLYTSILFLTLLSVLRWLAVAKPRFHRHHATPTRTLLVCLGIWFTVAASSTPFLFSGVRIRDGWPRCFHMPEPSAVGRILIINYLALALGFLLPFLTIIVCYSDILRHLRDHTVLCRAANIDPRHNRRRSVHLIGMVAMTFLICFLPYHVIRSMHLHAVYGQWDCGVRSLLQRAVVVTLCLAAYNSVVNPLLYYYSTKMFRDDMRDANCSMSSSRRRKAENESAMELT